MILTQNINIPLLKWASTQKCGTYHIEVTIQDSGEPAHLCSLTRGLTAQYIKDGSILLMKSDSYCVPFIW